MKLIEQALAALDFAEKRFHELLDAPTQIAAHVKDLAKATAGHVKDLEARLAATEELLERVRGVLEEVSGGAWNGLVPAAPIKTAELVAPPPPPSDESAQPGVPSSEAPSVIPIPLSPDVAAAPATG